MWRCARGTRFVHDEVSGLGATLAAVVLLSVVTVTLAGEWRAASELVFPLLLLVVGGTLRRRVDIDRANDRVRVAWVLAPTPCLPGLRLRALADRRVSDFAEVVVDVPSYARSGRRYPVELVYKDPMRHGGVYVDRVLAALFVDPRRALAIARRLADDLGVQARDVRAKDSAPAVAPLGM